MDSSGESAPKFECCYNCIQTLIRKWPKLFNKWTFRLLTCINFFLTGFVTATPFWTVELLQDSFTFMGLWSICHPKSCNKIKVSDDEIVKMRILMLIVLASCFLGVLCAWDFVARCTGKKTIENIVSATANFNAGIAMLGNLLVLVTTSEEVVFLNFYLGCILCLLSVLLGVISVMKVFYWISAKKRFSTVQETPA